MGQEKRTVNTGAAEPWMSERKTHLADGANPAE